MGEKGFTLIELLVVLALAIIMCLVVLAVVSPALLLCYWPGMMAPAKVWHVVVAFVVLWILK
jgi:prepilin-type N-terminal cleavage/methylation domain-containing protein